MKRSDLTLGLRVRTGMRSRYTGGRDEAFVLDTEPWCSTGYGLLRFHRTTKGSGVAVAIKALYGDGWKPEVVQLPDIAPYDEAIAQEHAQQERRRAHDVEHARKRAVLHDEITELARLIEMALDEPCTLYDYDSGQRVLIRREQLSKLLELVPTVPTSLIIAKEATP